MSFYAVNSIFLQAKAVEYVQADDNTRRWLADFRTKSFSQPISLESIDGESPIISVN